MPDSMTVCLPKGSDDLKAPIRLERPAARITPATSFTTLALQIAQRPQRVLPRHLLAPLINEVSVVEWARFDVGRFSSGVNLVVNERLADQWRRGCFNRGWRGGDSAEYDLRIGNRVVVQADIRRDTVRDAKVV